MCTVPSQKYVCWGRQEEGRHYRSNGTIIPLFSWVSTSQFHKFTELSQESEYITHTLQWTGASKLSDNLNMYSKDTAWCSRSWRGKKRSTSSSQCLNKEQKNIKKILKHCWGGGAINYSRIFAFCGGSWNQTLLKVRVDCIEKCECYFLNLYFCAVSWWLYAVAGIIVVFSLTLLYFGIQCVM